MAVGTWVVEVVVVEVVVVEVEVVEVVVVEEVVLTATAVGDDWVVDVDDDVVGTRTGAVGRVVDGAARAVVGVGMVVDVVVEELEVVDAWARAALVVSTETRTPAIRASAARRGGAAHVGAPGIACRTASHLSLLDASHPGSSRRW